MTYRQILVEGENILKDVGIDDYKSDAWLLFEYAFGMNRTSYLVKADKEVEGVISEYLDIINERATRKPLQHITGVQEFYGLEFIVNENVLIPRQDTEILVEEVIKIINNPDCKDTGCHILDMCTGSGCIAITLAKNCENTKVTGVDISDGALEVAVANKEKNSAANVDFIQSNLFENINNKFDIIVSNPPYIESDVIDTLMQEVKDFEPRLALDGEADGLKFYREITKQSLKYMKPSGYLLYEIGHNQGEAVSNIMIENGYTAVKVIKDLAGLDRVVMGHFPEEMEEDNV
ncbi:MAG: peptide chain release factor N(5)-glutamine methyltransferase [Lachnospiraceae bacterium]|nr:peptide chain release factor N(5)-glutamine methyltransferase [Lachnospiraceae bacterium]